MSTETCVEITVGPSFDDSLVGIEGSLDRQAATTGDPVNFTGRIINDNPDSLDAVVEYGIYVNGMEQWSGGPPSATVPSGGEVEFSQQFFFDDPETFEICAEIISVRSA